MFNYPKTQVTSIIKFDEELPVVIDLGGCIVEKNKFLDNRILKAKSIGDLLYYVCYKL